MQIFVNKVTLPQICRDLKSKELRSKKKPRVESSKETEKGKAKSSCNTANSPRAESIIAPQNVKTVFSAYKRRWCLHLSVGQTGEPQWKYQEP